MFEKFKKNIVLEKEIIADINSVMKELKKDPAHRSDYLKRLSSLVRQLDLLNDAVPELLKEIISSEVDDKRLEKPRDNLKGLESSPQKSIPRKSKTVDISYQSPRTKEKKFITLNKSDKEDYLKELQFSEGSLTSVSKIKEKKKEKKKSANFYTKYSNKLFNDRAESLALKIPGIGRDLKRGNVGVMASTYFAVAISSVILAGVLGFILFLGLFILGIVGLSFIWIPFVAVGVAVAGFYLYPAGEAGSVRKKITQELPFATIYMASVAGANIEPTKIFKIISESKEYPTIGFEMRKVVVQTDMYGFDLVTSLRNVANRTPNKNLAELLSGFATNISTGGELKNYLEQKAENFLLDYKLERQEYMSLAGTFMDVYISLLIAAPLVLMMMFIVMNVAGLGLGGISISTLLFFSVIGIVVMNILFLIVLNLKQPAL